ncbi:DUF2933 domain-containing protein [Ammoniphilus sp. 3BR4]|uniref:DUF2933 domain-containing protein n=1 Tax=Ammoniphilus sp. 3BR4 TaxID=3158265 RepID=UPI003467B9D5
MAQQILSYIPYLICPLMMLFCMRGMFGSKKDCHAGKEESTLVKKIEFLEKQNEQLQRELSEIKKRNVV